MMVINCFICFCFNCLMQTYGRNRPQIIKIDQHTEVFDEAPPRLGVDRLSGF